jgi:serine/threonine protein kinase
LLVPKYGYHCFVQQGLELYLQRELTVLKNLRYSDQQFMVTYIGAYSEPVLDSEGSHALFILTEYCQGGELLKLVTDKQRFPTLGWKMRVRLAYQASSAINHLHDLNFIHRDIKAENFLLDSDWNCKLTDFGLSREIADPSVPTK